MASTSSISSASLTPTRNAHRSGSQSARSYNEQNPSVMSADSNLEAGQPLLEGAQSTHNSMLEQIKERIIDFFSSRNELPKVVVDKIITRIGNLKSVLPKALPAATLALVVLYECNNVINPSPEGTSRALSDLESDLIGDYASGDVSTTANSSTVTAPQFCGVTPGFLAALTAAILGPVVGLYGPARIPCVRNYFTMTQDILKERLQEAWNEFTSTGYLQTQSHEVSKDSELIARKTSLKIELENLMNPILDKKAPLTESDLNRVMRLLSKFEKNIASVDKVTTEMAAKEREALQKTNSVLQELEPVTKEQLTVAFNGLAASIKQQCEKYEQMSILNTKVGEMCLRLLKMDCNEFSADEEERVQKLYEQSQYIMSLRQITKNSNDKTKCLKSAQTEIDGFDVTAPIIQLREPNPRQLVAAYKMALSQKIKILEDVQDQIQSSEGIKPASVQKLTSDVSRAKNETTLAAESAYSGCFTKVGKKFLFGAVGGLGSLAVGYGASYISSGDERRLEELGSCTPAGPGDDFRWAWGFAGGVPLGLLPWGRDFINRPPIEVRKRVEETIKKMKSSKERCEKLAEHTVDWANEIAETTLVKRSIEAGTARAKRIEDVLDAKHKETKQFESRAESRQKKEGASQSEITNIDQANQRMQIHREHLEKEFKTNRNDVVNESKAAKGHEAYYMLNLKIEADQLMIAKDLIDEYENWLDDIVWTTSKKDEHLFEFIELLKKIEGDNSFDEARRPVKLQLNRCGYCCETSFSTGDDTLGLKEEWEKLQFLAKFQTELKQIKDIFEKYNNYPESLTVQELNAELADLEEFISKPYVSENSDIKKLLTELCQGVAAVNKLLGGKSQEAIRKEEQENDERARTASLVRSKKPGRFDGSLGARESIGVITPVTGVPRASEAIDEDTSLGNEPSSVEFAPASEFLSPTGEKILGRSVSATSLRSAAVFQNCVDLDGDNYDAIIAIASENIQQNPDWGLDNLEKLNERLIAFNRDGNHDMVCLTANKILKIKATVNKHRNNDTISNYLSSLGNDGKVEHPRAEVDNPIEEYFVRIEAIKHHALQQKFKARMQTPSPSSSRRMLTSRQGLAKVHPAPDPRMKYIESVHTRTRVD